MLNNSLVSKFFSIFSFSLLIIFAAGCAGVRLNTIPAPPPTAKLRVFMQVLTAPNGPAWSWKIPHQVYEEKTLRGTAKVLQREGIYEVVTQEDVKAVLGGRALSRVDWARKNWALAKQAGQALHAEYMLLVERSKLRGTVYWEMVLINTQTEKKFRVLGSTGLRPYYDAEDYENIFRIFYQELIRLAKNDMLATAIRKGRLAAPQFFMGKAPMPPPPSAKPAPTPLPPSSTVPKPPVNEKPSAPQEITREVNYEELLSAEAAAKGGTNLAVYDLDTIEPYRVVALILSEALRQELFKLGIFHLVNRENIVKVLEEMALQQTGLVDEKEAARAGRGLAAQQIILGRFGILGRNFIVQAKRVDVETQGTIGLGTLRCDLGREDELLEHMTELAREIAKKK